MFTNLKRKAKGVLGLDAAAIGLLILTFIVALTYIVMANLSSSTTDLNATNAIANMTAALNTNLTGNFSIIVIAIVFGALLVLFKRFRA